jgi:hypothetical protein
MVKNIFSSTLSYALNRIYVHVIAYSCSVAVRCVHRLDLTVCLEFYANLELTLLESHLYHTAISTRDSDRDRSFLMWLRVPSI